MTNKELPLLDSFYDDEPLLTAEKCIKPFIKQIYLNKVVSRNITTAVLFWGSDKSKIEKITDGSEFLVDDICW